MTKRERGESEARLRVELTSQHIPQHRASRGDGVDVEAGIHENDGVENIVVDVDAALVVDTWEVLIRRERGRGRELQVLLAEIRIAARLITDGDIGDEAVIESKETWNFE